MRKRFLVTLAIISGTLAISLSGCKSEGGKEEPKATQASKGTEEDNTDDKLASNETQKTDETEKTKETDKPEETTKPDEPKVTKAPDMDAGSKEDASVPTEHSKSEQAIAVLDSNGAVKEYLDSTDEDYRAVYNCAYQYMYYAFVPEVDDIETHLKKQNEVCDDTIKWTQEKIDELLGDESGTGESFNFGYTNIVAFNEDKTWARILYNSIYINKDGEEDTLERIYDVKKYGDKWLITAGEESTTSGYIY